MNKYFKAFGLISILCFSFFYTEKIAKFMQSKDPLYVSIMTVKDDYHKDAVDAVIENNYIIPGLTGVEVNVDKSFQNMQDYGYFVESDLVFDEITPTVSLSNHRDKIVKKGNALKNSVALIVKEESLITYLEEMGIFYNVLVTTDNVERQYAHGLKINYDFEHYDEVEKSLKNNKESNSLCFVTGGNQELCKQKKKVLVEESLLIQKSNLSSLYKSIATGDIIYLDDNLGITNLKLLISQIQFKGLNIVYLSDLLSEARD